MQRKVERRRRLNPVVSERRKGKERRKLCPQCRSPLLVHINRETDSTQRIMVCTNPACKFEERSRQTRAGKPGLQQSYPLPLRSSLNSLLAELPREFCDFTGIDSKTKLVLKIVGESRWILEIQEES